MEGTRGCIHAKRNHHHLLLFYLYSPCKKKRPHLFKKVTLLRIFAYKMEGRESCNLLLGRAWKDWSQA